MRALITIFNCCNKYPILKPHLPSATFAATICSKELRDPNFKKAKPFDYKNKKYSLFQWHVDSTLKRFHENTKVIVVDGNIGAGKTAFAKKLAEQFDMKYIPEPSLDRFYITPYGYDVRCLDPIMPPSFKSCDVKTFYENPRHMNVGKFQMKMFMLRYLDYINALSHLLNTGDGIVFDRSVYSDFVFVNAMCEMGYVSKGVKDVYHKVYQNCVEELMRPHLVVYLDVNPDVALQRIRERNDPNEINSEVFKNADYLKVIDDAYKKIHLPKLADHSEILIYDWNNYGDVDVIIEDIERIDFEIDDPYSKRLEDWYYESDWTWGIMRWKYTRDLQLLLNYSIISPYEAPELDHSGADLAEYQDIMEKVPGMKYASGFNPKMKDNVMFKNTKKSDISNEIDFFPFMRKLGGMGMD